MVLGTTLKADSMLSIRDRVDDSRGQDLSSTVLICKRYRLGTLDLAHFSPTYRLTRRCIVAWLAGSAYRMAGSRDLYSEAECLFGIILRSFLPRCWNPTGCWKTTGYGLPNPPEIARVVWSAVASSEC
jgi:hypothetical protein